MSDAFIAVESIKDGGFANYYLVDRSNFDENFEYIKKCYLEIQETDNPLKYFVGFDTETTEAEPRQLVGFSIAIGDNAWYFNYAHSDEDLRISKEQAIKVLESKPESMSWVIHNAPFDLVIIQRNLGIKLTNYQDTLLLCICLHGPDDINLNALESYCDASKFHQKFDALYSIWEANNFSQDVLNKQMATLLNEGTADEGDSNSTPKKATGFWQVLKPFLIPRDLKNATEYYFQHKMAKYEEVRDQNLPKPKRRRKPGPGLESLPAIKVAHYGCEDAFWANRLMVELWQKALSMNETYGTDVLEYYQETELPMVDYYVETKLKGIPVDLDFCKQKLKEIDLEIETCIANLKPKIQSWSIKPVEELFYYQYLIEVDLLEPQKAFEKASKALTSVLNWGNNVPSEEYPMGSVDKKRIFLYDILGCSPIYKNGKLVGDKNAIGKLEEDAKNSVKDKNSEVEEDDVDEEDLISHCSDAEVLSALRKISAVKSVKASGYGGFLNNATLFNDSSVHSEIYPFTKTRRLSCSKPNTMNPPKRGESGDFRRIFIPDDNESVILSLDWSAVELVVMAEKSNDPVMMDAYRQIPHGDLHARAALDICKAFVENVTFEDLKKENVDEILKIDPRTKDPIKKGGVFKYWRNQGKTANFNFWYSMTVFKIANDLGMTDEQRDKFGNNFISTFKTNYDFMLNIKKRIKELGFILLGDGSMRSLPSGTNRLRSFIEKAIASREDWTFEKHGIAKVKMKRPENFDVEGTPYEDEYRTETEEKRYRLLYDVVLKQFQNRELRKGINSNIQGFAGTIAKRSIIGCRSAYQQGLIQSRMLLPIHDELIFSTKVDSLYNDIIKIKEIMMNHPSILKNAKLNAMPAVGINFGARTDENPYGQIELAEPIPFLGIDYSEITPEKIDKVTAWLKEGLQKSKESVFIQPELTQEMTQNEKIQSLIDKLRKIQR